MPFLLKQRIVHAILIPYLLIYVVLVCLVGDGVATYLGERIERLLAAEAGNSLNHTLYYLDRQQSHFADFIGDFAARSDLAQAVAAGDRAAVVRLLRQLHSDAPGEGVVIFDAQGRELGALSSGDGANAPRWQETVAEVLQGKKRIGLRILSNGLVSEAVLPVLAGETVVGGVAANQRLDDRECRGITRQTGSAVFLFDNDGQLLASSHGLGKEPYQRLRLADREGEPLVGQDRGVAHFFFDQEEYVGASVPLRDQEEKPVGVLMVAKDTAQLTAVLQGVVKTALLYGLGGLAVIVFIALLIAQGITAPLRQLVAMTSRVAGGDLAARVSIASRNEVGALADAFNAMTGQLQAGRENLVAAKSYTDNIIRSMTEALVVVGSDGRIDRVNAAACRLVAYREEELIGQPFIAIVSPGDEEEVIRDVLYGAPLYERDMSFLASDGEVIPVSVSGSCLRAEDEAPLAVILSARDMRESRLVAELRQTAAQLREEIGERQRMEEQLRASEERYRTLFEMAVEGIMVADSDDGTVAYANPAMAKLLGRGQEELLHMRMADIFAEGVDEPAFWSCTEKGEDGQEGPVIVPCRRRDGTILQARVSSTCMPLAGKVCRVSFFSDATAEERAREAMERALTAAEGASRAKTEFIARVSHELRTPMNGIIGFSRLLAATALDDAQQRHLGFVQAATANLLTLLEGVLDFAKMEAGKLVLHKVCFDLRQALAGGMEVQQTRAVQKGLRFSWQVEPDVPEDLCGDPDRLWQVFDRLIDNAIRFTGAGEVAVWIGVRERTAESVLLHCSVRDTGIGVPMAEQPFVFTPFTQAEDYYTRRHGGLGLGLALSSRLVEMMGGEIWLESKAAEQPSGGNGQGPGSTFHFTARFGCGPAVGR